MQCLADNIKYLEQDEHSPIRAIGVLGSDVYDKLLILRALRDRFPKAIFFITDLDARLYYHTERPWTRNLIVVSSYGLQLHPHWQNDIIPPFRSTYQTSLFDAACQARETINEINIEEIPPRIFEIGNRGPYDLTPVSKSTFDPPGIKLHPDRHDVWELKVSNWRDWMFNLLFMCILPIIVFSGLYYYNRRKQAEWKEAGAGDPYQKLNKCLMVFLVACICSFVVLTYFAFQSSWNGDGDEPLSFFDGISIWPTDLIRLSSGFLSVYFLLFSIQSIIRNDHEEITPLLKKLKKLRFQGDFQTNGKSKKKWFFIGIAAGVYLFSGCGGFIVFYGFPLIPFRGNISWYVDICILLSSRFFMLYLIMFFIYTTWCCRSFIINQLQVFGKNEKIIGVYRLKMDIVEKKTEVIGEMIKYSFLVLFILEVARHKYFDNWTWTIPLAIFIVLTTLLILGVTILLFHTAKKARQ